MADQAAGGSAIIAVNCASAATLPSISARPANLQTLLRFLEIVRDFVLDGEHSAIVALHDLDQAARFDRLILVNHGTVVLDGTPAMVLGSEALGEAFGIERRDGRWAIRRPADPRSSR